MRAQTERGKANWGLQTADRIKAFVVLPHCMQTSAKFWQRTGFSIGEKVDGKEHKQATLQEERDLRGAEAVSQWSMRFHDRPRGGASSSSEV